MPINSFLYPGAKFTPPYQVTNSLRFNRGSSDYLNKTFSSAGSRTTWTISVWVKRANEHGTNSYIIDSGGGSGTSLYFGTEQIEFWDYQSGSYTGRLTTNRVFRDMSAWMHIVAVWDTTNGTAGNRMRLYVNGVEETSFATDTNPSSSQNSILNDGSTSVTIGRQGSIYSNLYMAEFCYIDGQALTPTSFGEFDSDSPTIWKPKSVSGLTFGTNGFYLEFKQSGTSQNSSGLGADTSGNDHHFAVNNLTAIDQSTDTCTNNFATMNPLDNYYADSTFSEGNLKYTQGSSRYAWNLSTIAVSSGKWYAEAKLTTSGSNAFIGITDRSPVQNLNDLLGSGAYDYSIHQANGDLFNNAGTNPANDDADYAASYANGDIIGIALDLDNNKIYFSKGGQWSNGSGAWDSTTFNSSTGAVTITAPASTTHGHYFFASGDYQSGAAPTWEWNYGGTQSFTISSGNADANNYGNFEYSVPSGYYALNTKNLAEFG